MNYHQRMDRLHAVIRSGRLGRVKYEAMYFSRMHQPFQVVVRDEETGVVRFIELHEDGSVRDGPQSYTASFNLA